MLCPGTGAGQQEYANWALQTFTFEQVWTNPQPQVSAPKTRRQQLGLFTTQPIAMQSTLTFQTLISGRTTRIARPSSCGRVVALRATGALRCTERYMCNTAATQQRTAYPTCGQALYSSGPPKDHLPWLPPIYLAPTWAFEPRMCLEVKNMNTLWLDALCP